MFRSQTPRFQGHLGPPVVLEVYDDLCHSLLHPQPDATDVRDPASSWAVPVQRQHLCTKPCKGHWPHRSMWMLLRPRLYPDIQDGPPPCSGCWCSRSRLTKSTVRLLSRHTGATHVVSQIREYIHTVAGFTSSQNHSSFSTLYITYAQPTFATDSLKLVLALSIIQYNRKPISNSPII